MEPVGSSPFKPRLDLDACSRGLPDPCDGFTTHTDQAALPESVRRSCTSKHLHRQSQVAQIRRHGNSELGDLLVLIGFEALELLPEPTNLAITDPVGEKKVFF